MEHTCWGPPAGLSPLSLGLSVWQNNCSRGWQLTDIPSRTCATNMLIVVHSLPLLHLLPIVHILLPLILLLSLIHNTPPSTPSSPTSIYLRCTISPPKSKVTTQPRFYCFILQRYPMFKDNTWVLTIYIKHKGFLYLLNVN